MNPRHARLNAHAKINLDLRVLSRRIDDFHELRTVFQSISIADELAITVEPAEEIEIWIDSSVPIEDNLVVRAARSVLEAARTPARIHFDLRKNIPMGAGLGGGSSDAAAVLIALPRLLGVNLPFRVIHDLAAQLGSDVPFFLYGGAAVGIGRGEELYPLPDFPDVAGLLVCSEIHVSTAEAYRSLGPQLAAPAIPEKTAAFAQFVWSQDLTLARNDFEAPIFALYPELPRTRELLIESGALAARMTGSGSAIFALFPHEGDAGAAARRFPQAQVFRFIHRAEYQRQFAAIDVRS